MTVTRAMSRKREDELNSLRAANVEPLDQPVFQPENVPHHVIEQHVALEIAHRLMHLNNHLTPVTLRKAHRLHCRVDHLPLPLPIAANAFAPVNVPTFHPIRPQHIFMHTRQHPLHITSVEPSINLLQEFEFASHPSLAATAVLIPSLREQHIFAKPTLRVTCRSVS